MKVLNEVKKNDFPLIIDCECGAKLEIEKEDIDKYCSVSCPICKKRIDVREFTDECNIAKENITFPIDFYHFSKTKGAVNISNAKINNWIQEGFKYFEKYPDKEYYYVGSGDSIVILINNIEEIQIFVAQGYYEYTYDK